MLEHAGHAVIDSAYLCNIKVQYVEMNDGKTYITSRYIKQTSMYRQTVKLEGKKTYSRKNTVFKLF